MPPIFSKKSILPSEFTCCSTILSIPEVSQDQKEHNEPYSDLMPQSAFTLSRPGRSFDEAITVAPSSNKFMNK